MRYKAVGMCGISIALAIILLSGAAFAENKTFAITVNEQATEKADTNYSANIGFIYSYPAYWSSTSYYNIQIHLYLSPNNATNYSATNAFYINYGASATYLTTVTGSVLSCTAYCYNYQSTTWIACTSATANISIIRCAGYYAKSYGTPQNFWFYLPANAPFTQEDARNLWTGRDYMNWGDSPTQPPTNEYWGNTTIATPAINITNASAPSNPKINLGREFYYNITVRNENTTNHTGKAYGVFLYPLTEGVRVLSSVSASAGIENNRSQTYNLKLAANTTLNSFLLGAMDNGTSARRAFNASMNISTINVTDQLLVGIREPINQSYGGGAILNITANISYIDGTPHPAAGAYANITGIASGIRLYYNGGLYRGNYTLNSTIPTPWTIVFYANDSSKNWGVNTTLFYDLIAPTVANLSAANITDRQNATINVSVWDALGVSGVKAQVYWNTTGVFKNYTLTNYSGNRYSVVIPQADVVPGLHNITIFANDTSGRLNDSVKTTFRVNDTTPPVLENISLREAKENENALANASAWDIMGVSEVLVEVNSSVNYTMGYLGGNRYNKTFPPLSAGVYNLTFYATDMSGNTNSTNRTLRINDSTPPRIIIGEPKNGTQVKYGQNQRILVNATDNYEGVDRVWMVVDGNQSKRYLSSIGNGQYNYSIMESIGPHEIRIYANDSKNNTGEASTGFIVSGDVVISLPSPDISSPQNAGKNITWTTTVENASGTVYYQYNISRDNGATWRIGRGRNESNAFVWRTNATDGGLNLIRVYISNSTGGLLGNTSATYNISTTYRIEAEPLQYNIYMRGETMTFAAKIFDVQNQEIASAQANALLTEGQTTLSYNGTRYTGTLVMPANATAGNWTANISALDAYNSGSRILTFNVSGKYTLQIFEPYENDSYLRGDGASVNLTIKNARGELLYNLSEVEAHLQKEGSTKQAVGLEYSEEYYKLYFPPPAFNTTDAEGAWEVYANASQSGNSGNASTGIVLNATLLLSANASAVEVYTPIRLNFTIERPQTIRTQENSTVASLAYFYLNKTDELAASSTPVIGTTPFSSEYTYDTDNNGKNVNKTGQWKLKINITDQNDNYGETEATLQIMDTQAPTFKLLKIRDIYAGRDFENSNGAKAYPNDTIVLETNHFDNYDITEINITITSPIGANATIPMQKYWSSNCGPGFATTGCDDSIGSTYTGAVYYTSRWNASFSQTGESGNYTIALIEASDGAGNINRTTPEYTFEIVLISIGVDISPVETNVSLPVAISANITGNLTNLDYARVNISGAEGSFEYPLGANISYTSTRSDWHVATVKVKSANYLAESSALFWINYGAPVLTTKLADNQTQINGTYKSVNMSITAIGGDLKNVKLGGASTNDSVLRPDFDNETMALLGNINNSQTTVFPFGFTSNETGTVNITMIIVVDTRDGGTATYTTTYANYSIIPSDTQPPQILYVNTTTRGGYANINESVKVYAKISDNVEVANATVSINCTETAYNRTGELMTEETINTELVWSYQFAFTGQPANCTFNISARDSSGLASPPKQSSLNASTAYSLTASKTGPEPLMRGESINFTTIVKTINGNTIVGAEFTYNLTRPDNSTDEWTGASFSGYLVLQSDPSGTYLLRINASKYWNRGNASLQFTANSTLVLDPQHTQEVMRGNRLVFNTSVKNARGESYEPTVNLSFLNQTYQLTKIYRYTHEQSIPLNASLGMHNISILAYKDNNTATARLSVNITPANLSISNLRHANTISWITTIGRGDSIRVSLNLLAQNNEYVGGANITGNTSTGENIVFNPEGGGAYSANALVNTSQRTNWTMNVTASHLDNAPVRAQISLVPINKKWRDVDNDSYLEFAEDYNWTETYEDYKDPSTPFSTKLHQFPLSPHNGFIIATGSLPDVFWSPYDNKTTSIMQLDLAPKQGYGASNPYEYYVDTDGDGNLEKQYTGQLSTTPGKKLVYSVSGNNLTHLYAFDLQNIGRHNKVYDSLKDTTIFCGGAKYTVLGTILGNDERSEYILGKSNSDIPNLYWDAKTNSQYVIFNDALNSYYVEADGRVGKTEGDLIISISNNTCSFAIAACGNGACQPQYAETTITCPQDCQTTQQSNPPAGGSSQSGGAPAAVTQAPPKANVTEKEPEGLEVIIQAPTNLLVTQGNNLTFQITLASTAREYPLGVSFKTDCCEYSYAPKTLTLHKGGSADVSIMIATALSTKTGEYAADFTVTYKNYTKSRSITIKVEASPVVVELAELKSKTLLLKESLRQLNQTSGETKKATEEYALIVSDIEKAEKAVEENNPAKLGSILEQAKARQQNLQDDVKVLMKKQGIEEQQAAIVLPEQPSYLWIIILVALLVIGSAASVVFREQIQQSVFKKAPEEELRGRIEELTSEEARIVQMKKATEREYFSRKLDQKTFLHIMSEYESKQIDMKARLAEAQQKLAELTKPKSEKEKVELLELQKMPEGKKLVEQTKRIGGELERGDYSRALEEYTSALDSYNKVCKSLPLEEQRYLYDELNREYSKLEEFRGTAKKITDLYSALRNCKNCVSSEKYDLAKHFFGQAHTLHKEIAGSEFYRKHAQHEEIEKVYKEISEFHKTVE